MDDEVLRQALVRQWHVLPKFIKRMHIEKITVVDIFAIADISKDFNSRYPKIKNSYAIDPIMALEHVLEDRSSVPEILDVLIYPSFKMGPSLPTHVELVHWNGRFRYADEKALTNVVDHRKARIEYYHPWGWWARLDCEKEINTSVCGPLLILRYGDHPEAGLHREQTIGMRELSYNLFHAGSENFYIVLPEGIFIPDTNNALHKFNWQAATPVSLEEIKQVEYDTQVIAMASCTLIGGRMKDIIDRVSWELGGVHFKGWYWSVLPVAMEASILHKVPENGVHEKQLVGSFEINVYQT